jgi:hypothetical protein
MLEIDDSLPADTARACDIVPKPAEKLARRLQLSGGDDNCAFLTLKLSPI